MTQRQARGMCQRGQEITIGRGLRQTQRLSVVLQLAAVEEIMRELGLAAGRAVDPGDQRVA